MTALKGFGGDKVCPALATLGELPEVEWKPGVWPVEKYKAEKEIRSAGDRNLKMW